MNRKTKDGRTHPYRAWHGPASQPSQNEAENKAVPFLHNPLNRGPGYRRK